MASNLSAAHFHNEQAAYAYVEARLWPDGPVCPFCGAYGDHIGRLNGKTTRVGLRKCYGCRRSFTVKMRTIFEDSHAPLRLWLQAIYMICSSKKGISTRQLQRTLGVGMKTAWHMGHRIRLAMVPDMSSPIGGAGKTVEADEMFIGHSPKTKKGPGYQHKMKVLALVERGGDIRSMPIRSATAYEIKRKLRANVHPESRLVTDGAQYYKFPTMVAKHESVDHVKREYVRGDVHTNTLEGYFSVFKRGIVGVFQHVSEQHLHRYCAEFDFRQNTRDKLGVNDAQRAEIALKGVVGKRLTYQTTDSKASEATVSLV